MPHSSAFVLVGVLFATLCACAHGPRSPTLQDGHSLQGMSLQQVAARVSPGSILVLGENHDNAVHSAQHLELLHELRKMGLKVSVGMEFLSYPVQSGLDAFLKSEISETEFLKAAGWGGANFDYYRAQILFPRQSGGWTYALNSPQGLSSKIAKGGLEALDSNDRMLLPPQFTRGRAEYFERFKATMGGHLPSKEKLEHYFLAQSLWDDTMAWQALQALQRDPAQVLVIIVGEFHVQYGGGLPDRLIARGARKVLTLSQMNIKNLTANEVAAETSPVGVYGPRADFLWISNF
jgi:uncharacterized iron-regulated protein